MLRRPPHRFFPATACFAADLDLRPGFLPHFGFLEAALHLGFTAHLVLRFTAHLDLRFTAQRDLRARERRDLQARALGLAHFFPADRARR